MTKKITLAVTIAFLAGMLLLTLFAQPIHNASLPVVTAARPETRSFSQQLTDADGNTMTLTTEKAALPISLCEGGVYVLYTAEKNGTERQFVRLANIQTGAVTEDGYVEVVSGLMFSDRIVTEHTGELFDGVEVIQK